MGFHYFCFFVLVVSLKHWYFSRFFCMLHSPQRFKIPWRASNSWGFKDHLKTYHNIVSCSPTISDFPSGWNTVVTNSASLNPPLNSLILCLHHSQQLNHHPYWTLALTILHLPLLFLMSFYPLQQNKFCSALYSTVFTSTHFSFCLLLLL